MTIDSYYRKAGDLFQLVNNTGAILAEGPAVAIAFDVRDFTLLKHGMPNRVARWYRRTKARYLARGDLQHAADLIVAISNKFGEDELNNILNVSDYLKLFCAQNGIEASAPLTLSGIPLEPRPRRLGQLSCHNKPQKVKQISARKRSRRKLLEFSAEK